MQTSKLGDKLRTLRELHGIKQEDIADRLGISQNTYSKLETGETKVTLDRLEEIAQIYKMQVADLLNFDPKHIIHQINTNNKNNDNNNIGINYVNIHNHFEKERELYAQQIKHMQDEIDFLKDMIEHLKKK